MIARDGVDVGIGCGDIAGLHRLKIADRFLGRRVFDDLDKAHQFFGPVVADIVETVRRNAAARFGRAVVGGRLFAAREDPGDDIVDISEIALHLAVVEDLDRLARQYGLGEQPRGHVGASPRAIDREKT